MRFDSSRRRSPVLVLIAAVLAAQSPAAMAAAQAPFWTSFETGEPGLAAAAAKRADGAHLAVRVGNGPAVAYTAKPGVGFSGMHSLGYEGQVIAAPGGKAVAELFDVSIPVTADTVLSYKIFPGFIEGDLRYPSTFVAIDLLFADGTRLSELGARDQQGFVLSPLGQGESKSLYTQQWNARQVRLGEVAAGKVIDKVLLGYQAPFGPAALRGWLDDIRIAQAPAAVAAQRPSDQVLTTRGTNSSGDFSRGNNIPATAMPHGFNFWTPVTDAGSLSWIYEYAAGNDAQNRPRLQALALSHETSPWMGDRQTFQVMPSSARGVPGAEREARSASFPPRQRGCTPALLRRATG